MIDFKQSMKIFSSLPTDLWKFSPSMVDHYTVWLCNYSLPSLLFICCCCVVPTVDNSAIFTPHSQAHCGYVDSIDIMMCVHHYFQYCRNSELAKKRDLQPVVHYVSKQHDSTQPKHNRHGQYCNSIESKYMFFFTTAIMKFFLTVLHTTRCMRSCTHAQG